MEDSNAKVEEKAMDGSGLEEVHRRQMSLTTVVFNEASIDSPSFRASVNFFQTKITLLEKWIKSTIDFVDTKYEPAYKNYSKMNIDMISQMLPSPNMLGSCLVTNQSDTQLLLDRFHQDYKNYSSALHGILTSENSEYPKALVNLMNTALEPYATKRKNFEYYQVKYDDTLADHNACNNTEPSILQEQAISLFELRKSYIGASLELVAAIEMIRIEMDRFIIKVVDLIKSKYVLLIDSERVDLMPKINEYLVSYKSWIETVLKESKSLVPNMKSAQDTIYRNTKKAYTPSNRKEDYDVKVLEKKFLNDNPKNHRKAGWLFMKTSVGSGQNVREIWVRRWCFVHKTVFGMFALSADKTYVEETDKFGLSLLNVQYLPTNERKLCFEVTVLGNNKDAFLDSRVDNDINIILQGESIVEVRSWLQAFHDAGVYLMGLDNLSVEYDSAFRRYPPPFIEFASKTTTTLDLMLTTQRAPGRSTQPLMEALKTYLSTSEINNMLSNQDYQFNLLSTPITTKMTQLALLSTFIINYSSFPSAVQANIWGTSNWNDFAYHHSDKEKINKLSRIRFFNNIPFRYPDYYPSDMRILDVQFRSTFLYVNQNFLEVPEQLVLLRIRAVWSPNKKQQFAAVFFVTVDHLNVYFHNNGFTHLVRTSFSDIRSVDYDRNTNVIHVRMNEGLKFDIIVHFDDYRLVATKLESLVENAAMSFEKNERQMFESFQKLDFELEKVKERNNIVMKKCYEESGISSFWTIEDEEVKLLDRRYELKKHCAATYNHSYKISSRGLLHIMFGSSSKVFPQAILLAERHSNNSATHYWRADNDHNNQLIRKVFFQLNRTADFLHDYGIFNDIGGHKVYVTQRIVKMVESKYYEIDQGPILIKYPFCRPLCIIIKYTINENHDLQVYKSQKCLDAGTKMNLPTSRSDLNIFYDIHYVDSTEAMNRVDDLSHLETVNKALFAYFTKLESGLLHSNISRYMEKLGNHGKVVHAIKLCGMLTAARDQVAEHDEYMKIVNERAEKETKDEAFAYSDNLILKEETAKDLAKEYSDQVEFDRDDHQSKKTTVSQYEEEANKKTLQQSVDDLNLKFDTFQDKILQQTDEKLIIEYDISILIKTFLKLIFFWITVSIQYILRLLIEVFNGGKQILGQINKTVLVALILSFVFNLYLSGKSTKNYWSVKRAENNFHKFLHDTNNNVMKRALYTKDIDIITDHLAYGYDNPVFKKFNDETFASINPRKYEYKNTRQELAIRRNELLVELKLLQSMEKELVKGDYRMFLLDELANCQKVSVEMFDIWNSDNQLREYCGMCQDEFDALLSSTL